MAEVVALPGRWLYDVALATPPRPRVHPAGLEHLPSDWSVVDGVTLPSGPRIDHVVVGPNGVFTVGVDPETIPAEIHDDGLYRHGVRVTTPVKHALLGAHELRRALGLVTIAYPILVTAIQASRHHLDRLGVVPGERIAEHIWSHPGLPLRRSQRVEVLWALRRYSG
ncbi:MAG TPA: nuclease-related domain-containing protein [Acidimicrobiia bacterium]|nr:nuclease-related domain-containing protein [Acidimicrobiia bacterium]